LIPVKAALSDRRQHGEAQPRVLAMSKPFDSLAAEVSTSNAAFRHGLPEAMRGFNQMGRGTYVDGALSTRMKELVALAIATTIRCDGCVAYHARRVAELGASREEVLETLAVVIQMGGGPGMVYGGEALAAFDHFAGKGSAAAA
jgi:AhpD family alkylhydroperoxidase